MEHSLWANLPLLIRANSKESVENILETLWKTRKVGLESADRDVIRDTLQLQNDSDLDPLLVCLRMLIRKCVCENANRDDIQKLIPAEVSPEIQRLLTLLLQKFHREWREDISKDQLQSNTRPNSEAMDVNFPLAKDRLETMLKSLQRDQQSNTGKPKGFAKYQWATIVETSFSGTDTQMVSALASVNSTAGDLTIVHDLPTSASPRAKVLDFVHGVVRAHDTLGQRPDGIHISSCTSSESTCNAAGASDLRESERRSAIARGKRKLDCNTDARFSSRRRTQRLPISETGINSSSRDRNVRGFVYTPHVKLVSIATYDTTDTVFHL